MGHLGRKLSAWKPENLHLTPDASLDRGVHSRRRSTYHQKNDFEVGIDWFAQPDEASMR